MNTVLCTLSNVAFRRGGGALSRKSVNNDSLPMEFGVRCGGAIYRLLARVWIPNFPILELLAKRVKDQIALLYYDKSSTNLLN